MDILTFLLSTFVTQDELQASDVDRVGVFLAQWLVLLGEESLALQTVITYLKRDKKRKEHPIQTDELCHNHSECQIMVLFYAQIYSKSKNYLFFRDPLFM